MKRFAVMVLLGGLALTACSEKPQRDQALVDACYLSIGVAVPGDPQANPLGSIEGWRKVAARAMQSEIKDVVHAAERLAAAVGPDAAKGGFDSKTEVPVYRESVLAIKKLCDDREAFTDTTPFATP